MSTRRPATAASGTLGVLAALSMTVLMLASSAGTASAHAVLEATTPKNGATLGALPAEVTLRFDEPPIGVGAVVQVNDPTGEDVSAGTPRIVDNTVHQTLASASPAPAGTYRVAWRVTSDDGHPVSGKFTFTLTGGPTTTPTTTNTTPASPTPSATNAGSASTQPGTEASPDAKNGTGGWLPWAVVVVVVLALIGLLAASPLVRRRLNRRPNP